MACSPAKFVSNVRRPSAARLLTGRPNQPDGTLRLGHDSAASPKVQLWTGIEVMVCCPYPQALRGKNSFSVNRLRRIQDANLKVCARLGSDVETHECREAIIATSARCRTLAGLEVSSILCT